MYSKQLSLCVMDFVRGGIFFLSLLYRRFSLFHHSTHPLFFQGILLESDLDHIWREYSPDLHAGMKILLQQLDVVHQLEKFCFLFCNDFFALCCVRAALFCDFPLFSHRSFQRKAVCPVPPSSISPKPLCCWTLETARMATWLLASVLFLSFLSL